jgi:tRNA pseudouridine55 synthase
MRNGLLLLDKPTGITSHDLVHSVRRWSSQRQVGHAGTLDPLATGLMVVLLGEATKLSDYILNGDKAYIVELKLGVTTDSGDSDGAVTAEKPVNVSAEQVEKAVASLRGSFVWPVPIYSAVKTGGKKLYELARANVPVVPPSKPMHFKEVELLNIELPIVKVFLGCSKGSFVRTWVQQLGEALQTGATVVSLRRTASIPYSIDKAVRLDTLAQPLADSFPEGGHWIPLERTLPDWWSLKVEGVDEKLIKNGQISHKIERFLEIECPPASPGVKIHSRRDGSLLALLMKENNRFSIKRVFSYTN